MKPIVYLIIALATTHGLHAQDDIPLLLPEERQAVDAQAEEFSRAISPVLSNAALSTVRVWSGSRRLAYGTVVGDGTQILTKWSEIARATNELRVDAAGGESRAVKLAGVYEAEDLVLLKVIGNPLVPVSWSFEAPKLGAFIAASQPDGKLAAFGVVSVLERNLRDTDLAYLGVIGEPGFVGQGVKVREVAESSGAAAAGLQAGNVILKVGERTISGLLELKNALTGVAPGATVSLRVATTEGERDVNVLLGNRPSLPQFTGDRLEQMERMGGPISQVRDSFTHAIQTDMRPKPNQIGGPVVDLKGRVLGITMARADRTRSFVMPATAVVELLKKEAANPALAQVRSEEKAPALPTRGGAPQNMGPRGRDIPAPRNEERMRRHLSDMQRLMDHMQQEMEGLNQR